MFSGDNFPSYKDYLFVFWVIVFTLIMSIGGCTYFAFFAGG